MGKWSVMVAAVGKVAADVGQLGHLVPHLVLLLGARQEACKQSVWCSDSSTTSKAFLTYDRRPASSARASGCGKSSSRRVGTVRLGMYVHVTVTRVYGSRRMLVQFAETLWAITDLLLRQSQVERPIVQLRTRWKAIKEADRDERRTKEALEDAKSRYDREVRKPTKEREQSCRDNPPPQIRCGGKVELDQTIGIIYNCHDKSRPCNLSPRPCHPERNKPVAVTRIWNSTAVSLERSAGSSVCAMSARLLYMPSRHGYNCQGRERIQVNSANIRHVSELSQDGRLVCLIPRMNRARSAS